MALCGGTKGCGCAVISTPAVVAAADGAFPTITVIGGGTQASPWDLALDTNWATTIADRKNQGYAIGAAADSATVAATPTDIAGLTVPFTAIPTAVYRTRVTVNVIQNVSAGNVLLGIYSGGGTLLEQMNWGADVAGRLGVITCEWIETGLTGAQSRKAQISTSAGNVQVLGTSNRRSVFSVDRIA